MASTLPTIKVSLKFKKLGTKLLGPFALGTHFKDDVDCTDPDFTDDEIAVLVNTMTTTHNSRQISPGKTVTSNEKVDRLIVVNALVDNAMYAQKIANKKARLIGDINVAIEIITRLGFGYTIKEAVIRKAGFGRSGQGWVQAYEEKSVEADEIHYWEFGFPSAMDVSPTSTSIATTPVTDVIFSNLKVGTIFAYRHASTTTVAPKSGNSPAVSSKSSISKTVTPIPISKSKHPIIDVYNPIKLNFGPWRFYVAR